MPRLLTDDINTLRVNDNISGTELELYYRTPITEEQTGYRNECIRRKGRKVESNVPAARLKYGMKVLTGFRSGDFTIPGADGEPRPIASDEKDENYVQEWREHVKKYAADIVQLLAAHVFDAPVEINRDSEEDAESD